jgi:PTH1 family peptidyl-tRNA hydrolase
MLVDYFREKYCEEFGFDEWRQCKKLKSETSYGKLGKQRIILLKPQTFMNLSGEAVAAAKKYYKLKLEDLTVAHDEIDLPLGKYKFSKDSSSAGHQGVQNIIDLLGTQDFTRIRVGVDNRGEKKIPTEKYVLQNFILEEKKILKNIFTDILQEIIDLLSLKLKVQSAKPQRKT